jgi:hypothetical protein
MTISRRRDRRSVGGTIGIDRDVPELSAARAAVVNIERLLKALLESEIARFKENPEDLRLFFKHYFDALVGEDEREEFVTNFIAQSPTVALGYQRASAEFPVIAIILESENEADSVLGDYAGETDEDDDDESRGEWMEYEGGFWESTFGLYVYAQHPDVCLYLYNFVKMILISGRSLLLSQGVMDVSLTGGELNPDEAKLPENMFIRFVRVSAKSAQTVPRFARVDPRRLRVYGLFMEDVIVDGVRGGVMPRSDLDEEEG